MKVIQQKSVLSDATYAAAEKVEKALQAALGSAQVNDDARVVLELAQAVNAGTDPLALAHVLKILIRLAAAQDKNAGPLASVPFDVALDAVSGLQNALLCQMSEIADTRTKRDVVQMH